MTTIPNPQEDLKGCLEALTAEYGAEFTFSLIGGIRDHRGADSVAGVMRARLARELVDAEMADGNSDEVEAIRAVGERLGYKRSQRIGDGKFVNTLTNFARLVRGITRTRKPIEAPDEGAA